MKYCSSNENFNLDLHLNDSPTPTSESEPEPNNSWVKYLVIGMCIGSIISLAIQVEQINQRLKALEKRIPVPAEAVKP